MTEEEKEVLKFFENKEYSFTCEVPKKELYEALGIEETDFETEVIRINILLNLLYKQKAKIEELTEELEIYKETENEYEHELARKDEEIEELKQITSLYNSYEVAVEERRIVIADTEYFEKGYFKKKFISKDKIKEKIKELSKTQAYKVGLEEYTIKILNELLEE